MASAPQYIHKKVETHPDCHGHRHRHPHLPYHGHFHVHVPENDLDPEDEEDFIEEDSDSQDVDVTNDNDNDDDNDNNPLALHLTSSLPINIVPSTGCHAYEIQGVLISFPYKAYQCQLDMMDLIIQGITRRKHCLLETPSGTGKTAAMLCSLLAWQQLEKEKQQESLETIENDEEVMNVISPSKKIKLDSEENDDVDGESHLQKSPSPKRKSVSLSMSKDKENQVQSSSPDENLQQLSVIPPVVIYYVTKTHSHIDQVVKQLTETSYSHIPKVILSCKKETFFSPITKDPSEGSKVDELCLKLRNAKISEQSEDDENREVGENQEDYGDQENLEYYEIEENEDSEEIGENEGDVKNAENLDTQENQEYPENRETQKAENTKENQETQEAERTEENQETQEAENTKENQETQEAETTEENQKTPEAEETKEYQETQKVKETQQTQQDQQVPDVSSEVFEPDPNSNFKFYDQKPPLTDVLPPSNDSAPIPPHIVFCTYNHLLHRHVREASGINLQDSIIVFDEGHIIEDMCCSLTSRTLSLDHISLVKHHLDEALKRIDIPSKKRQPLKNLTVAFSRFLTWLQEQQQSEQLKLKLLESNVKDVQKMKKRTSYLNPNPSQQQNQNQHKIVKTFSSFGFGPQDIPFLFQDCWILEDIVEYDTVDAMFKVDSCTMKSINNLLYVLTFLFATPQDFQVCLVNELKTKVNVKTSAKATVKSNVKKPKEIERKKVECEHLELHIICLNPALTFAPIKEAARTIIITSGSLSPMDSFTTELDVEFPHDLTLSTNHVLTKDKIYSAIVSCRDNAMDSPYLNFSWTSLFGKHQPNFNLYSKELIEIILNICTRVPQGIVIFGPSKMVVKKLKRRWEKLEYLEKLKELKDVYWEHECNDKDGDASLGQMLQYYRQSIKESNVPGHAEDQSQGQRGAVLFAYFRGRISNSVYFHDDEGRAVVTIGIPMAPFKSEKVQAKLKYNDERERELRIQNENHGQSHNYYGNIHGYGHETVKKYLTGSQWYNTNAIRTLNQAVGRCVRQPHSGDWGMILMVEDRLGGEGSKYRHYLSKWILDSMNVRGRICKGSMTTLSEGLGDFLKGIEVEGKVEDSKSKGKTARDDGDVEETLEDENGN